MIKIVAKLVVDPAKIDEFKALAKELVEKSAAEAGNASYTLNQGITDPNALTFIEYWKDQDAIASHNASEHFNRILPQLAAMATAPADITLYSEVEF